jgi:hypothetical protein
MGVAARPMAQVGPVAGLSRADTSRSPPYQFKFGIDLPISNKSQRMDYALVTGLTCLF